MPLFSHWQKSVFLMMWLISYKVYHVLIAFIAGNGKLGIQELDKVCKGRQRREEIRFVKEGKEEKRK